MARLQVPRQPTFCPKPAQKAPLVQAKTSDAKMEAPDVQATAREGIGGAGGPLPHRDAIKRAFGRHDVSKIVAHSDEKASTAARALGAEAFTTGSHVAFFGSPSLHTVAHEAAHAVQQQAGVQLLGGMGKVGDAYERNADAVADAVVAGRSAESLLDAFAAPADRGAQSAQHGAASPVVQRKVFINDKLARIEGPDEKLAPDPSIHVLTAETGDIGDADRKIVDMTQDSPRRYFKDQEELEAYAQKRTEDIGWVDRQKAWIRLPECLVLGERHSQTTLPDLVEATGIRAWQYEGERQESAHLKPNANVPKNEHAIEAQLPKYAVGLVGVASTLRKEVRDARAEINAKWKGKTARKNQLKESTKASALAAQQQHVTEQQRQADYEAALQDWSQEWEEAAEKDGRSSHYHQSEPHSPMAPSRPYKRPEAEARCTLQALEALRDSTLAPRHPLKAFYLNNEEVITTTITQLQQGTPVQFTRMFLKMVTGKFDFERLLRLFKAEAEAEFRSSGVHDLGQDDDYNPTTETAQEGHRMEELRDSYMLHNIIQGKKKGVRLFGIGDKHRENLEAFIKKEDSSIEVYGPVGFWKQQYRLHSQTR